MKRLVIAGMLVFLAVLIATFPATVAYSWFAPPQLQLNGISGSIWNGSAAEGKAGGAYVRNISWRFRPSSLLSGRIGFSTRSNPASGTLLADVALGAGGDLLLSGLSGNLPLDLLHPALQQSGMRGDIVLAFETIALMNGRLTAAEGSVTVSDFYVPEFSAANIGDYRADFTTTDDAVVGSVEDVSGMLDVAGTISLRQDGFYSFVGLVAATSAAPPSIVNQLSLLGSANERGQHQFRLEGQL